jgi:hypothetical protein
LCTLSAQRVWESETDNIANTSEPEKKSNFKIDDIEIPYLSGKIKPELSPVANFSSYKTLQQFDSLKNGASNNNVTKTLYNLLVVSEQPGFYKSVNNVSNEEFTEHEGKIIRSIGIQTLGPYGLNLSDIDVRDIYQSDNLFNKTHINTKERKIRNQLFFSSGDVVDPTQISDNERIIRELPYIYDCRIVLIPSSDEMVDIIVLTKDVYSLGLTVKNFGTYSQGTVSIFERNLLGLGHELSLKVPYDAMELNNIELGKGFGYNINNLFKSFANLRISYIDSMNFENYGVSLTRGFYNYTAKYAGGITLSRRQIKEESLSLSSSIPQFGKYDTRDIWLARSFLIEDEPATRIVIGARYIYNDAKQRPEIEPHSYQYYQNYHAFLGSITFSSQRYYKNNLIYAYGRTEDIPYGGIFTFTAGKEFGEFKDRYYTGATLSLGQPLGSLGYIHSTIGLSSYSYQGDFEQGVFLAEIDCISNLYYLGAFRMRNFLRFELINGNNRYKDEYLEFVGEDGFTGFRNDSIIGTNRLKLSLESVVFGPRSWMGFRFAYFAFGDVGYLFEPGEELYNGNILSSIGLGIRLRNDNLVLNTISIRFSYYPTLPDFSNYKNLILSGEQLLRPANFEPIPPTVIPYFSRQR